MGQINDFLRKKHILPFDDLDRNIIGDKTRERIATPLLCPALAGHGIPLLGISDACPPFSFVRHAPKIIQILICLEGRGEVWVEGAWRSCEAGMAYLTPVGVPHAYHAASPLWKVAWVHLEENSVTMRRGEPELQRLEASGLVAAVAELCAEALGRGDAALLSLWAEMVYQQCDRLLNRSPDDERLHPLWAHVNAELNHQWTIDELASLAGLSGEHLRRLCRRDFGRSPLRHVTHLRMQHAASLLASRSYTVEHVAHRVGYENAFAFSTAFKREMGAPPSAFRPAHTRR